MKIVIVGGVAGGASAAARARRLDENAEIVIFERGEHPSFANCGLPYYVGGKIEARDQLLVAPAERLRNRYRLDVRLQTEVTKIDSDARTIEAKNLTTGQTYCENYDKLIIATGASPFRPDIPGINHPKVLGLRDLKDADRMHELATSGAKQAVIVGGGFIGIEVAENLLRRKIRVAIVEFANQILGPWDAEMVQPMQQKLIEEGIEIKLEDSVVGFEEGPGPKLAAILKSGERIETDFAVVSIGVRPENKLATDAAIECGQRGGIVTTSQMQTNLEDVYAVGDVAEVEDFISGGPTQIPLAGPANRQGRIAADNAMGRNSTFRGTQGTAIVGAFGSTAAMTGHTEKALIRDGKLFEKIYIHPSDHAGYYPGAAPMSIKLLFDPDSGRILGAEAVGSTGVDKRIDVIAMAIQARLTVFDLEEAELCYAPQYGHAKDPINMLGFVASSVIRGDHPLAHVADLELSDQQILDVRTPKEFEAGHIPQAVNIPLDDLRERLDEIPKDRPIVAYCKVGMRGYQATRILMQNGYQVANLSGGFTTWKMFHPKVSTN